MKTVYLIKDCQNEGRYFADGARFGSKKEVMEQLASYHDNDFTGCDDKDNELSVEQYFRFWGYKTVQDKLDFLLDHGCWEIEKVKA
uniref:Uncharacterized protein n=1 Tax=viral metagenome TaxID=1070528 RepID=A0A6M3XWH3_9ZZZZ